MNAALVGFYGLFLMLLTVCQVIYRRDQGDSLQEAVNDALHRLHRTLGLLVAFVAGLDLLVNSGLALATWNALGMAGIIAAAMAMILKLATRCRVASELPQAVRDAVMGLLERMPALGPAPPIMMATGMTRAAFHVEHRPAAALGFGQQRDQGGDDEEGDGNRAHQTGFRDGLRAAGAKVGRELNFKACQAGRASP